MPIGVAMFGVSPSGPTRPAAVHFPQMQPLPQALAPWHDFFTLSGEASATMTGLLFVAASVGRSVMSPDRRGALRMFFSGSVVKFAGILVGCLVVLAPIQRWSVLGGLVMALGLFGLAYSAAGWRDAVRDGLLGKIDLEDRLWYGAAPAAGYLVEAWAGVELLRERSVGCGILAVAMGSLLVVAIHNSWDITIWLVTRRKE